MLDNYNYVLDGIREKIKNRNFTFNKLERGIIQIEKNLLDEIVMLLSEDYSNWKTLNKDTENDLFDFSNINEQFIFNYYKNEIETGTVTTYFDETGLLNEEQIADLDKSLKEKLKDSNYKINGYISVMILKIVVDAGRFDILEDIKGISDIYDETIEKIKKHYFNNNLVLPKSLDSHIKSFNISFEDLTMDQICSNINLFDSVNLDDFIKKIKNESNLASYKINWDGIFNKLNLDQKFELLTALREINYFDPYVASELDNLFPGIITNEYQESYEKCINSLVNAINSKNVSKSTTFGLTLYFSKQLLNDYRIIEALINNNYIDLALHSPNFKNYELEVVAKIKANPEMFKNIDFTDCLKLNHHHFLLKALLEIDNTSAYMMVENDKELYDYLKNKALNGQIDYIPYFMMNNEFVNQMICNGYVNIVFSNKNILSIPDKISLSDDAANYLIQKAENDLDFAIKLVNKHTILIINSEKLLNYFLKANESFIDVIINKIKHLEESSFSFTEKTFNIIKEYLVGKYNLNQENLEAFERRVGPEVIRYINNDNIQKFINMPKDKFEKLLALFPNVNITMADIEKIYDALKQYEFSKTNNDVIEIFANIMHSISDDNNEFIKYINNIIPVLDDRFYKRISIKYASLVDLIKKDPQGFLISCVLKIKNGSIEEKNQYLEVLHEITNYYISVKREEYRDKCDMYRDLSLPYTLDENDTKKQYIKYYLLTNLDALILDNLEEKGYNRELMQDCISYYARDNKNFSEDRLLEIRQNIKVLIAEANRLVKVVGMSEHFIKILDSENKIKRKYYAETNIDNIFSIIANLRIDILEKTILEDEKTYQLLLNYINKYKLHVFPEYFKELMSKETVDISFEPNEISGFISFFQAIYELEKSRLEGIGKSEKDINMSIVPIIKYSEAYSSVSNIYNQILGVEDARLIKSDPKPNSSVRSNKGSERLDIAVNYTLQNFKRNKVTVPAINEVVEINSGNSGKSIRVVVGNFTHPANISYGERTGACMRIGGVGESLYKFCLEDSNGFHIRFEDPETGEFISRVSGFRNGNSVFLNELRYSCNKKKYSNGDVYRACQEVANILINRSVEGKTPIENVFLHNAYATSELGLKTEPLNITNNKSGLRSFYSDITDRAIVVASTGVPFKQIDFDKTNIPTYEPAREIPYQSYDNGKIRNMINRVYALKNMLAGANYEYIDSIEFKNGLYYGIASQDWYIFMDNTGKIYEDVLNVDSRAITELEEARRVIKNITITNNEDYDSVLNAIK